MRGWSHTRPLGRVQGQSPGSGRLEQAPKLSSSARDAPRARVTIGCVAARQTFDLTPAWNALCQADWATARDAFATRLEEAPDDPEALDGIGRALWWLGEPQLGIERRRQAYAEYKRRGDTLQAANLATYLAAEH